ncbi:unnamed protein product [Bemisia tabaci]|uniref:Uncharacterized protein n=1 Tax=Bemisia tabaci TaxID=7038 RepID=A0A9P0EX38_BEMTA|nr:PREDICTED: longitudinals lacking protein, isoforms H/M/V-like isoform X1 [Bemisia tabaci]CAH0382836.1 unnamed protein product [Bemisia tabaci]
MSLPETEQFSLRWNNFHSNLSSGFHDLLEGEDLVDVTLACDGTFVQAHKIVLSVCSPYFKQLFKVNPCKHPIVILKDVGHIELASLLQFMYRGEVNVRQEDLTAFLKTAELLQIKGLTSDDSKETIQSAASGESHVSDSDSRTCKNNASDEYDPEVNSTLNFLEQSRQRFEKYLNPSHNQPYFNTEKGSIISQILSRSKPTPDSDRRQKVVQKNCQASPVSGNDASISTLSPTSTSVRLKEEPIDYENDVIEDTSNGLDSALVIDDSYQDKSNCMEIEASGSLSDLEARGKTTAQGLKFSCRFCHKKFSRRDSLGIHVANIHGKLRGPFPCKICGKLAKNKRSLNTHMYDYHRQTSGGKRLKYQRNNCVENAENNQQVSLIIRDGE